MKKTCIVLALALLLVLGAEAQRRRCLEKCPRDYRPVCGRDRRNTRTFNNECELNAVNCRENRDFKIIKRKPC
ncbi:hypothetical protein C0J52_25820 [Blattella germanica]|nr:hypothetical protein C0J52_25820 [Blattella germanica]